MSWYKKTERQNRAGNAAQYRKQMAVWRQETNTRQWAKLRSICITNARLWHAWEKITSWLHKNKHTEMSRNSCL